ncbi:13232_t:CDS:2, partial [Cetraspora pellucida]
ADPILKPDSTVLNLRTLPSLRPKTYYCYINLVSQELLDKYKERVKLRPELARDKSADHTHRKGDRFLTCMSQPQATIIDIRPHPFYSVHIRTLDNTI